MMFPLEVQIMNVKKSILLAFLFTAVAVGAFARGPMGGCGGCDGEGPGGRGHGLFGGMKGFFYPGDKKAETITGTVLADKDRIPLVKSGKDEYILLFPWFLLDELNLSAAGQVTVTGFTGPSPISGSSQKILFAKTIKIGDKTYDVEALMKEKGFGPGREGCDGEGEGRGEGRGRRRGPEN
jgi:hypothetical protein